MREDHIQKMKEQASQSPDYALYEREEYREPWKVFKIMSELVAGYQFLRMLKKEVTIFGSARLGESHPMYKEAQRFGELLAQHEFITITGGGPGIMEAANRGAFTAGGDSVGLNIELPFEQVLNPYIKRSISFSYFFTRKVMLTSPANAFIFFPGGYGTLDEFFEVVDLMDLRLLNPAPIVLVGKAFWDPVVQMLRSRADISHVHTEMINSWHVVDTADEGFSYIKDVKDSIESCDLSPNNFHCEGNIDWKIFRVMAELVEGFDFLSGIQKGVTVLGTKYVTDLAYLSAAEQIGKMLATNGYSLITGGKDGIAAAANKGAFEQGGVSLGIGMRVGGKDDTNPYLTKSIIFNFPFTRKMIITSPSKAFIVFPGGFGTLHQLFEILTLIQTGKMAAVPVILYDTTFWTPLDAYIKETLVKTYGTIGKGDEWLYHIVSSVDEIPPLLNDTSV